MPLIIDFPVCEWCGDGDAHLCPICGHFTCWSCFTEETLTKCVHKKYEEKGDNWVQDDKDDNSSQRNTN